MNSAIAYTPRPPRQVILPNDGPGDLAARYALSEKRKAALARKPREYGGETYREEMNAITAHNRRLVLTALTKRSPLAMQEIGDEIGLGIGQACVVVAQMCRDGLVHRERRGNKKSPMVAVPTLKGLQWLEANQC